MVIKVNNSLATTIPSFCKTLKHKSVHYMTSGQETDSFAHLDKRGKQHCMSLNSRFDLHSPKALLCCSWKQHSHMFCVLSEETCLYVSADWHQNVARGQLVVTLSCMISIFGILCPGYSDCLLSHKLCLVMWLFCFLNSVAIIMCAGELARLWEDYLLPPCCQHSHSVSSLLLLILFTILQKIIIIFFDHPNV